MSSRQLLAVSFALVVACALAGASVAEKIYVHLIPHSHDDVGWLKTVDEYYYGDNNLIQHASVRYILDSVINQLQKNPQRTFSYVEMAYFTRWWNEQNEATKEIVRGLVANKQLEFVNAGWCMNDEATTDYNGIIDQMSIGLRFVEANFGPSARPRVAWHIDPFGHSAEQAALFAKMGYDGFFFWRIDYNDRETRLSNNDMEMVWRPSASLGEQSEIFAGVLYYGYDAPPGFCFDIKCNSDKRIMDDKNLFGYNVEERVSDFLGFVAEQAGYYKTNHIMFTMGSDFHYEAAHEWYQQLDKLIYYVNQSHSDTVEVFYSTPSRYLDAVHAANKTWTVKTDDFFPYADRSHSYWTGYYSSRPALKAYTRQSNSLLQTCKQIEVFGIPLPRKTQATSVRFQQALGIEQHHDAVSGTERQTVAYDYARRLHIGQTECQELINDVSSIYVASKSGTTLPQFQFCDYLNISVCPATETGSFNVLVYSPLSFGSTSYIHFPVNSMDLTVYDYMGKSIASQVMNISNSTKNVRRGRGSAKYDLLISDTLPPVGAKMYFVRPTNKTRSHNRAAVSIKEVNPGTEEDIVLDNNVITVTFDGITGRVKSILNKASSMQTKIDQRFMWWTSSTGDLQSSQPSGAYIFRPSGTTPSEINKGNIAKVTVVKGPLAQEVRQEFSPWVSQTVRIYNGIPIVKFEYTIGPIPVEDHLGKEIVSQFITDLKTNGTWYTDANGREMQTRKRNFRPTWRYINTEPVAGNYYPVDSRIYIRDESKGAQFTVLNDRSQGGASLNDGQLELMVHRRILKDDVRGLGEALNEPGVFGDGLITRGTHIVFLDGFKNSTVLHRILARSLMLPPQFAIMPSTENVTAAIDKYYTHFNGTTKELPLNVHILTLEFINKTSLLLRLEHVFEIDEVPYNTTVTVQLDNLFTVFKVVGVKEMTLGGNADLSTVHRLKWNTASRATSPLTRYRPLKGPHFSVDLSPMDIRTFIITVDFN